MLKRSFFFLIALSVTVAVGCGEPEGTTDPDGGSTRDGRASDGAVPDAEVEALRVFATVSPSGGVAPLPVSLNATAMGGTPPYGFSWELGDVVVGTSAEATHLFLEGGTFPAQVVVTDANDATAAASVEVSVESLSDGIVPLGVHALTQDIQADASGTVHILWVQAGNTAYYSTIVDDAIGSPEQVADGVTHLFAFPRLAVSADGQRVHTAYVGPNAWNAERLYHVERLGTGGFAEPEVVLDEPTPDVFYTQPAIAVDRDGTVHVIAEKWILAAGNPFSIMYTSRPEGGSWSDEVALAQETRELRDCSLYADRLGGLHASWSFGAYRYAAPGEDLRDSATSEIPAAADAPNLFYGDFFVTPQGVVHKVLKSLNPQSHLVFVDHTVRTASGAFGAPTRPSLGPVGTEYANQGADWMPDAWPAVAADTLGRVFVAWGQPHKTGPTELLVSVWAAGAWHLSVLDAVTGLSDHNKPSIAVTDAAVIIVWRNDDGELLLRRIALP